MNRALRFGSVVIAGAALLAHASPALAQSATRLVAVSGDAWVNLRHGETAPALVLKAVDASDRPVPGARVSFVNGCAAGYQEVDADAQGLVGAPAFSLSTSGYCELFGYAGGTGSKIRTYVVYEPGELTLRTTAEGDQIAVALNQQFSFEASLVFQGWRHLPLPITAEVTTGVNGATARRIEAVPLFGDTRVSGEGNSTSGDYRIVLRAAGLSREIAVAQRGPLARIVFDPPELVIHAVSIGQTELVALDAAGLPLSGVQPFHFIRNCAGETCVHASSLGATGFNGRLNIDMGAEAVTGEVAVPFTAGGISGSALVRIVMPDADARYQDMWWAGPGENGWGMSLVQHGDTLFGVIFGYDAAGEPTWWVMPGGQWNAARSTYVGSLYTPTGSPYYAYDSRRFTPGAPVGRAQMVFSSVDSAILSFDALYPAPGGPLIHAATKRVQRQKFAAGPATGDLGDMWWGGPSQDGWGIAILEQRGALFSVWFTYDAAGKPTWFVMPAGQWTSPTTYSGRLYRTRGSPLLPLFGSYDASRFVATDVGPYSISFQGQASARFDYQVDARSGSLVLTRQPF